MIRKKHDYLHILGFEGVHCEFDIDECSDDLPPRCHNNGRCLNYDGGFDCNCADTGYIG